VECEQTKEFDLEEAVLRFLGFWNESVVLELGD